MRTLRCKTALAPTPMATFIATVVATVTATFIGAVSASGARAEWSNAQSMYTEDGVEIGTDARVFALFAMLNGLGYDDDTERGPAPLHRPLHTNARTKARANLGRQGPGMKALELVIGKNPVERDAYVAAVLELGPAPNFDDKAATSPLAKAIAAPMRDWYNEEGGAGILRLVADEAKPTQKRLLPLLDKAVKATTALVRLGDKQDQLLDDSGAVGRVVVIINELDAHSTVQREQKGDVTYVVVGPVAGDADDARIQNAAVTAYARTLVAREAPKGAKPGSLADASKLTARAGGAKLDDKAYATELLACAFARQVRGKDASCVGSPVERDAAFTDALTVLAPRVDAFAKDTAVLSASVETLLAPPPPAPAPETAPPPAPEPPKKKGKK